MDEKIKDKKGWPLETIYEIIGDLICFEFILKIKTLIKDIEVKMTEATLGTMLILT